jgi:hypothetical protein
MATTQDIHAPTLGAQGEPCASCGAPLAGDQRYCLECGARRAQARVAFRDILATGGAAPTGPAAAAPIEERPPPRSGLAFLAGLLCLILALGVGVLIGNSGDDATTATAPPAQVITVGGAAAAPAATTPAATTTTDASSSTGTTAAKSAKGSSASKSSAGSKADDSKVKDLNSSSGADYQKKSQKLPKEVGTSGKPAPKDNKPAGAGSPVEDIG